MISPGNADSVIGGYVASLVESETVQVTTQCNCVFSLLCPGHHVNRGATLAFTSITGHCTV